MEKGSARRLKGSTIFLALLLLSGSSAFAGVSPELPETPDDLSSLQLLFALKREFPALLKGGTEYGFDPLEVLHDQQKLLKKLMAIPGYRKLMESRPDPLQISISQIGESAITETHVDPARVLEWRQNIEATLKAFPDFQAETLKTLQELNKRTAEGSLTGLIARLPGDQKATAFRQNGFEAKLEYLEHAPGIPDDIRARLPEVGTIARLEKRLSNLTELAIVLQPEPGQWLSGDEALQKIQSLGEAELTPLLDHEHYLKPRLDKLNEYLEKLKDHTAVRSSVVDGIQKQAKSAISHTVSEVKTVENYGLRLTELRPAAADFRGEAAGDCSTKYSFAAPNNPDELVFHVTDSSGNNKGYVEVTRLLENGKPTLYVSSINGPRISPDDVDLILSSLYHERKNLGVEQLALPVRDMVNTLMNYDPIRAKIKSLIHGKPSVAFTHTSPEIRKAIEGFRSDYLTMDYDSMAKNSRGILYTPQMSEDKLKNYKIQSKSFRFAPLDLNKGFDRGEAFATALRVRKQLPKLFDRTLRAFNISKDDCERFLQFLSNPEHLPLAEFEESATARFRELVRDPEADPRLLGENILVEGRLAASDAFSPEHVQGSSQLILNSNYEEHHTALIGAAEKLLAAAPPEATQQEVTQWLVDHFDKARHNYEINPLKSALKDATIPTPTIEKYIYSANGYLHDILMEKLGPDLPGSLQLIKKLLNMPAEEYIQKQRARGDTWSGPASDHDIAFRQQSIKINAIRALPRFGSAAVPVLESELTDKQYAGHAAEALLKLIRNREIEPEEAARLISLLNRPETEKTYRWLSNQLKTLPDCVDIQLNLDIQ